MVGQKIVGGEPDILDDLPQQRCGDVPAGVEWHRCRSSIRMSELPMRTSLANLDETESQKDCNDFARFKNGKVAHRSGDCDLLNSDELGFQLRLAVLQQHGDDFLKVAL